MMKPKWNDKQAQSQTKRLNHLDTGTSTNKYQSKVIKGKLVKQDAKSIFIMSSVSNQT